MMMIIIMSMIADLIEEVLVQVYFYMNNKQHTCGPLCFVPESASDLSGVTLGADTNHLYVWRQVSCQTFG